MILKNSNGESDPMVDDFHLFNLWIQIHSLPIFAMTTTIGHLLGKQIGEVLEVESDSVGTCIGRFLRVRIRFDIGGPTEEGLENSAGKQGGIVKWIDFK